MKILRQGMVMLCALTLLAVSGCNTQSGTQNGEQLDVGKALPELSAVSLNVGEELNVVATTSIVADVVQQIGGDNIVLKTLIPMGADPHTFEPTPQDITAVVDAHVVFSSGLGLEAFLDTLIANAGDQTPVVPVSLGIHALESSEHEGEDDHSTIDPHTWFDPNNVIVWAQQIKSTLQTLDPDNASQYEQRAAAYQSELENLDIWISELVDQIAEDRRKLVTDHQVFNYFAERYGFEQIGTVVPGYNASAQPSARELADLERRIETYNVKAIFVGKTVNPDLAQQIAKDMGIRLVFLYTGSLSESGGDAESYLDFMRYNTQTIVESLK